MDGSATALSKEYGVPESELKDHVRDLLSVSETRRSVNDDARRRRPGAQLRRDDRLVGGASTAWSRGSTRPLS